MEEEVCWYCGKTDNLIICAFDAVVHEECMDKAAKAGNPEAIIMKDEFKD